MSYTFEFLNATRHLYIFEVICLAPFVKPSGPINNRVNSHIAEQYAFYVVMFRSRCRLLKLVFAEQCDGKKIFCFAHEN